jgi:prepilin-type processing-associated H-X9-DG protein
LVIHNLDQHSNEVVDLRPRVQPGVPPPGSGGGGGPTSDGYGVLGTPFVYRIVPTNYGMSLGVYRAGGRVVDRIDSKLFLILDFPKRIVNFTGYASGGKDDESPFQDKYFITDPDQWVRDYGQQGEDWRTYQSLRHFGRANVLFCDGHVESLGLRVDADDAERGQDAFLDYTSSRWMFRGQ